MDYPVKFRKLANLHIQDGRHRLICISDIDDRRKRSPVANIHTIFAIFFLNTLWLIIPPEFENQLICIFNMAVMG